jgi:hypothetical protein
MFGPSTKVPWKPHRRRRNALGVVAVAFVVAFFMIFTASESHACPPGFATTKASLSHKLRLKNLTASKTVMTAAVFTPKSDLAPGVGSCYGGAPHSNNSGCSHGCCSSGAVALLDTGLIVALERISSAYVLAQGDQVTLANPDPNFRPPRLA